MPTSKLQPTPQYAHVVRLTYSGLPCVATAFSKSASVGHSLTHAPHETQLEAANPTSLPATTLEAKPRPSIEIAKVPWISSQARTQRAQAMHLFGLNEKKGLESSISYFRFAAAR